MIKNKRNKNMLFFKTKQQYKESLLFLAHIETPELNTAIDCKHAEGRIN